MKTRILVADDDPFIVKLVAMRLRMADYEVLGVGDGNKALAMIRDNAPALAILDVHMPGKDGLSILRELKTDSVTCDIPVMILTGERDNDTVMGAVGAGAADYMVKPVHPDRLMERVERIIAAAQSVSRLADPAWEV